MFEVIKESYAAPVKALNKKVYLPIFVPSMIVLIASIVKIYLDLGGSQALLFKAAIASGALLFVAYPLIGYYLSKKDPDVVAARKKRKNAEDQKALLPAEKAINAVVHAKYATYALQKEMEEYKNNSTNKNLKTLNYKRRVAEASVMRAKLLLEQANHHHKTIKDKPLYRTIDRKLEKVLTRLHCIYDLQIGELRYEDLLPDFTEKFDFSDVGFNDILWKSKTTKYLATVGASLTITLFVLCSIAGAGHFSQYFGNQLNFTASLASNVGTFHLCTTIVTGILTLFVATFALTYVLRRDSFFESLKNEKLLLQKLYLLKEDEVLFLKDSQSPAFLLEVTHDQDGKRRITATKADYADVVGRATIKVEGKEKTIVHLNRFQDGIQVAEKSQTLEEREDLYFIGKVTGKSDCIFYLGKQYFGIPDAQPFIPVS